MLGKIGQESAAARFAVATPSNDFSIQSEKPYAEVQYHIIEHRSQLMCLAAMDGNTSIVTLQRLGDSKDPPRFGSRQPGPDVSRNHEEV